MFLCVYRFYRWISRFFVVFPALRGGDFGDFRVKIGVLCVCLLLFGVCLFVVGGLNRSPAQVTLTMGVEDRTVGLYCQCQCFAQALQRLASHFEL